jgi:YesN/AraC family two-component response regulator
LLLCTAEAGEAPSAPVCDYPQAAENALLLALQAGNAAAAKRAFADWLAAFCTSSTTVEQLQHYAVMLVHAVDKRLLAKGTGMVQVCGKPPAGLTETVRRRSDAASMTRLFADEWLPAVTAYYSRCTDKHGEVFVAELKKLAESQYNRQLSLQQIAGRHYLNPDYAGRLFKKATGKHFVDYLTDVRIAKAKELMRISAYKNYEIAQMVGYDDYRYFSQIFKKRVGMTIGEYRSRPESTAH